MAIGAMAEFCPDRTAKMFPNWSICFQKQYTKVSKKVRFAQSGPKLRTVTLHPSFSTSDMNHRFTLASSSLRATRSANSPYKLSQTERIVRHVLIPPSGVLHSHPMAA